MTAAYTSRLRFKPPINSVSWSNPSAVNVFAAGLFKVMRATCPSILQSIMSFPLVAERFAEELDDGGEILGTAALRTPQLIELLCQGAHGHRLLGLFGGIGGEPQGLEHETA